MIEVYALCAAKEVHAILVEGVTHAEYEATKQSFLTECVNASRIQHPNVVQVLGIYYPSPGAPLPWLVMEMMECNVKGFLQNYKKDKIPLHFKLSILVDISQGLEFLHGQDIIPPRSKGLGMGPTTTTPKNYQILKFFAIWLSTTTLKILRKITKMFEYGKFLKSNMLVSFYKPLPNQ